MNYFEAGFYGALGVYTAGVFAAVCVLILLGLIVCVIAIVAMVRS